MKGDEDEDDEADWEEQEEGVGNVDDEVSALEGWESMMMYKKERYVRRVDD